MKYNELIEKYRNGELGGEEAAEVSREIEKHEAISDYLAERDDIPELSELEADAARDETAQQDESKAFAKKVRRQIRRAFLKAGVITGLAVLAAVLFCIYALPKLVDKAYYDPNEVAGRSEHDIETDRMSIDTSVYTELFLPTGLRQDVSAASLGFGKYSVLIRQNFSLSGAAKDTAGILDKGKLTLYDPNVLQRPVVNIFDPMSAGLQSDYSNEGLKQYFEPDDLDEEMNIVYVTFDSVKSFGELDDWCRSNDVSPLWAAVSANGRADYPVCGFCVNHGSIYQWCDDEKYPNLTLFSITEDRSEEALTRHVSSLFAYAADHYEAMEMLGGNGFPNYMRERLSETAEFIKENGLEIYGAVFACDRDTAIRLHDSAEGVAYMWTEPAK